MYVCLCKGLTESEVQKVALEARGNKQMVISALGLNDKDCCGRCAKNCSSLARVCSAALTPSANSQELLSTP